MAEYYQEPCLEAKRAQDLLVLNLARVQDHIGEPQRKLLESIVGIEKLIQQNINHL